MRIALVAVLLIALAACGQRRTAETREFPADYRGWAVVVWGEPGYPSLPTERGKLLLKFPADGIIITSTQQQFGSASDDSYFVDAAGKRSGPVPNAFGATGATEQSGSTKQFSTHFIGTDSELTSAPSSDARLKEALKRIQRKS